MTIKNIIFDLGGVIIDVNPQLTYLAFQALTNHDIRTLYDDAQKEGIFDSYETGKINSETFRNKLQTQLNLNLSDAEFDKTWNNMLCDLPNERLEFIKRLRRQDYRTFLLSNTNEIHLDEVLKRCDITSFNSCFIKQYYSHEMGYRKPDINAFNKILTENSLKPEETLFVDDGLQNILGAAKANIHTFHLTGHYTIFHTTEFIEKINAAAESSEASSILSMQM